MNVIVYCAFLIHLFCCVLDNSEPRSRHMPDPFGEVVHLRKYEGLFEGCHCCRALLAYSMASILTGRRTVWGGRRSGLCVCTLNLVGEYRGGVEGIKCTNMGKKAYTHTCRLLTITNTAKLSAVVCTCRHSHYARVPQTTYPRMALAVKATILRRVLVEHGKRVCRLQTFRHLKATNYFCFLSSMNILN